VQFGYIHLDALAGSIVSIFISYGGYELLMESKKAINGEDPHMEKFSKFLHSHHALLTERGLFAFLWVLNIKEMTKEEHLNRVKKGFGRRFPVKLTDEDYDRLYEIMKENDLVRTVHGKLELTRKGKKELFALVDKRPLFFIRFQYKVKSKLFNWFAEGL
jgi:hypothetical protein